MQKVPLKDLEKLAEEVLARLPGNDAGAAIVALSGDLGAGKTTFTQALARVLGVSETIQSPTYVLMRSYALHRTGDNTRFDTLIHIDAYRLESAEEFNALKPETFLNNPKNLIVIEWPERVEATLPTPDLVLKFSSQDAEAGERYIELV
jgi:tRNA threonylcarbamoyladenosine biosynthesis protein TsaE